MTTDSTPDSLPDAQQDPGSGRKHGRPADHDPALHPSAERDGGGPAVVDQPTRMLRLMDDHDRLLARNRKLAAEAQRLSQLGLRMKRERDALKAQRDGLLFALALAGFIERLKQECPRETMALDDLAGPN